MGVGFLLAMTDASPNQSLAVNTYRVITKSLRLHSTLFSTGTLPQDQELSAFPPQEPCSKFSLRVIFQLSKRPCSTGYYFSMDQGLSGRVREPQQG